MPCHSNHIHLTSFAEQSFIAFSSVTSIFALMKRDHLLHKLPDSDLFYHCSAPTVVFSVHWWHVHFLSILHLCISFVQHLPFYLSALDQFLQRIISCPIFHSLSFIIFAWSVFSSSLFLALLCISCHQKTNKHSFASCQHWHQMSILYVLCLPETKDDPPQSQTGMEWLLAPPWEQQVWKKKPHVRCPELNRQ